MCKEKLNVYISKHKWILLFAILYSLVIFYFAPINLPISDDAVYSDIAKNIVKGNDFLSNFEFAPYNAPGFPIMLAASMILFGDFFMESILALVSFFLIIMMFHFTKEITSNKKIATTAMFFFALIPLVVYNSMLILTDVPFLLFAIVSMWMYTKFLKQKNNTPVILWAVFTAFAILIRYIAGFLLVFIYIIHFVFLKTRKEDIKPKHLAIFLIIIGIILLPFSLMIYDYMFTMSSEFTSANIGHFVFKIEGISEAGEPLNLIPISIDILMPIQVVIFLRICAVMLLFITPFVSLIFLYKLYNLKRKKQRFDGLLLLWVFTYLVFHILYPGPFAARYLLTITPALLIFFSAFLIDNWKKSKNWIVLIILLQFIISSSVIAVDSQTRWKRLQTNVFAETGYWLKTNTAVDSKILCLGLPCTTISYYGERKFLTPKTLEKTVIEYIAVSNFMSFEKKPNEIITSLNRTYAKVKTFSDEKYYVNVYG